MWATLLIVVLNPTPSYVTQRSVTRGADLFQMCCSAICLATGWRWSEGCSRGLYKALMRAVARTHEYRQYYVMRDKELTVNVHRILTLRRFLVVDSCVTRFRPEIVNPELARKCRLHCFRLCQHAADWRKDEMDYVAEHGGHEDSELCILEDSGSDELRFLYRCFQYEHDDKARRLAEESGEDSNADEEVTDASDEEDMDADADEEDADGDEEGADGEGEDAEADTDMDSDDEGPPPSPRAPWTPLFPGYPKMYPTSSSEY